MARLALVSFWFAVLTIPWVLFASDTNAAPGEPVSIPAATLDSIGADFVASQAPGMALAVVERGNILFVGTYGKADLATGRPVGPNTAFHLASVGKQITAVAILSLVEEGRLSLEMPVAKQLPQLKGWGSKVTVRSLLQHTGGIPDYYDDILDSYRRPTNIQALSFLEDLHKLDFRPGAKFSYSNSGYDVLGALVQRASRVKFGEFVRKRIFLPAGMTNSFAFDKEAVRYRERAVGYGFDSGEYYLDDASPLNNLHGSGSIYASIVDMAHYDVALFGGGLLSQVSMSQLFTSGHLKNGRDIMYGFGWEIGSDSDTELDYYGHSGAWMGYTSYYLHYPQNGLSIIVLANSSEADPESTAFQIGKLLCGA